MRKPGAVSTRSDEALIAAAARRDPQAWAEIYERFSAPVFGFFVNQIGDHATAEDMTADVFLEALRAADRFRGSMADLRSWLFRIGRNNLVDHLRRQRRAPTEALDAAGEAELSRALPVEDPGEEAIARLDRARVQEAIRQLSPDQREVVLLRLAGGLTAAEIAGVVGKTTDAVKALQHRALVALARALARERPLAEEE
jgi:RNA polymerase sigma-70 factor (ECF subfamily)